MERLEYCIRWAGRMRMPGACPGQTMKVGIHIVVARRGQALNVGCGLDLGSRKGVDRRHYQADSPT